jgi:hypothetical protein
MDEHHIKDEDTSIDRVRRRLLKIGIYSVPAIMFLGRVNQAKASKGPPFSPPGPPFSPPGPPPNIPPVRR